MVDHRVARQFSNIISVWKKRKRWSYKSVTALMAISFIQYPLMISPENVNLDRTKLNNLINFKFKF